MAGPRTRKPPEGGSAKGARKAPTASVQAEPGAEAPYPRDGTQAEKQASAKADTARRTDQAEAAQENAGQVDADGWGDSTGWWGEDTSVPLLEVTIDRRTGELVGLRDIPRNVQPATVSPRPQPRARTPRRNVRTGSRKPRAPGSKDDDPPLADLVGLAAASSRLWALVRRREARQSVAA